VALLLVLPASVVAAGSADQALGIALALASALTFSLYVRFLSQKEIRSLDNTLLMLHILSSAAIVWAIPTAIELIRSPHLPIVWTKAVGGIAGLALLSTVLGCSFFSLGIRAIGSEKASILSVFEPVTAILVGVLLLGESLPTTFTVGAILIILGSFLVSRNKNIPIPLLQEKKDLTV